MWALTNRTPFACARGFQRDRDGAEVWVVAVRATFALNKDGSVSPSEQQCPVEPAPRYRGSGECASLLADTDLPLRKPMTDVILHGSAYAPQGKPAGEVQVQLKLGPIDKRLRVFGERAWRSRMARVRPDDPEPFVTMPLSYDSSFGGSYPGADGRRVFDMRNPAGRSFVAHASDRIGTPAPNVLALSGDLESPAGFGPIAHHWQPRVQYGGSYDDDWFAERRPLMPLDFDDRYYQCAPADQQAQLRGGEQVVLMNLTPEGILAFKLPRIYLTFRTSFGARQEEHRASLHTVVIEPDVGRLQMVYQTSLACQGRVEQLLGTVIGQKRYVGDER